MPNTTIQKRDANKRIESREVLQKGLPKRNRKDYFGTIADHIYFHLTLSILLSETLYSLDIKETRIIESKTMPVKAVERGILTRTKGNEKMENVCDDGFIEWAN